MRWRLVRPRPKKPKKKVRIIPAKDYAKIVVREFIEVFLHQIVYLKRIYPESIYCRRRKYNMSVMMAEHPLVRRYIKKVTGLLFRRLNAAKTGKTELSEKGCKTDKTTKPGKSRKSDKKSKSDKTNKSDKASKPDKTRKSNKTSKSDKNRKSDKTSKSDKNIKSDKASKPDKNRKSDKTSKPDKARQSDKTSKSNKKSKSDMTSKSDKTSKPDKAGKSAKSRKTTKSRQLDIDCVEVKFSRRGKTYQTFRLKLPDCQVRLGSGQRKMLNLVFSSLLLRLADIVKVERWSYDYEAELEADGREWAVRGCMYRQSDQAVSPVIAFNKPLKLHVFMRHYERRRPWFYYYQTV